MHPRVSPVLGLIVWLACILGLSDVFGATLIQGYVRAETARSTNSSHFSLVLDGDGSWLISLKPAAAHLDRLEAGHLSHEDTAYLCMSYPTAYRRMLRSLPSNEAYDADGIVGRGWIKRGEIPQFVFSEYMAMLWLAYSSDRYLDAHDRLLEPCYHVGHQDFVEKNLRFKAEVARFTEPPHLPRSVIYFNDGVFRGTDKNGKAASKKETPPYDLGYTNAIHQVLAVTNIAGLHFPVRFSFQTFRPQPGGKTNVDLLLMKDYTFIATNFAVVPKLTDYRPKISGPTEVTDRREFPLTGVETEYVITDSWVDRPIPDSGKKSTAK
ncbi:MAG TPA: hypothetical protein VGH19_18225 [Verrucomicrobiae bacterium]